LTSNRFLVKQKNLCPPHARLDEDEHHHLSVVLRGVPGQKVWLVDEEGGTYRAEVEEVGRRQTRLRLLEKKATAAEGRLRVVLAQSLIRPKNMDLIVQKATELGVGEIIPIQAARSVARLSGENAGKLARWRKIAAEASKQSRRSIIPIIREPQPILAFLQLRPGDRRFLLCEVGGVRLREILNPTPGRPEVPAGSTVVVLVGPEGGWTREERGQALEQGFEPVSLGSCLLRAETAALAALAAISVFWGA
jgi:16S rRNA (uracil1498-N3)-methyltransferase